MTDTMFAAAADQWAGPKPNPYLTDPVGWARDRLGMDMWSKQRDIAESVVVNRRTAVQSGHGIGKTWTAAMLAAWWIDIHPPGEAIVVSTAPTYKQVHVVLWAEIRKMHRKADLVGTVLQNDEWKLDDSTIVGIGRKPADTDEHGFQGIHRRYVLVIMDEACGIPEQLWTAVEAITTNADCRILAIGNPDDPGTQFARVCGPGSKWARIKVSLFDSPNFTDEPVADDLRPLLPSPEWAEDAKQWGETSPRYMSKVLGEFPDISEDTLISPVLIDAAMNRELDEISYGMLGVDVARFGSDQTVIYLRRGPKVRLVGAWGKQSTTETTGRVVVAVRDTHASEIRVDGVGVGGGVVDQLAEQGFPVIDMQAGSGAIDNEHYLNARAEWYWALRQRFEDGDIDIAEDDHELAAQLGALRYKYTSRGQVQIESKDDMKKRGLPSPDRADAVMLTAGRVDPEGDRIYGVEDLDPDLDDTYSSIY